VAIIEGSELPEEYLVITSHYDHEGIKNGEIYNGADDGSSGSMAMMEIAEAFQKAVEEGYRPKRSVVFMHLTGEEKGLLGSKYYVENPVFPLEQTVANLNMDMIGRVDEAHENDPNYIYLIGSDKLSTELHEISEEANSTYTNLNLDYTYNDENDPNRFYYRSDHYNFAKFDIPIIFYFNGVHEDYHQPTDTAEKIEYEVLEERAKLVFFTAWKIANRAERPFVDKPTR
jgi:Zn-dependent M28 family amino/carboxypeptidase